MKIIFIMLFTISIIPVSICGMIYGWGITPDNWGWVAFSYLWVIVCPIIIELVKD
jgi:hypothetical protein